MTSSKTKDETEIIIIIILALMAGFGEKGSGSYGLPWGRIPVSLACLGGA
jgi:hypothetical protein